MQKNPDFEFLMRARVRVGFGCLGSKIRNTAREREREREGWDGSRVCFVWGANREKWFLLARFSGTRDLNEFSSPHIVVCVCVFFFFFLGVFWVGEWTVKRLKCMQCQDMVLANEEWIYVHV